jgi:hypothetical protein
VTPAQAAQLVLAGVAIAEKGADAVHGLKSWLAGDSERPADLPELPDFADNELAIAAAEARGRKAGTIP